VDTAPARLVQSGRMTIQVHTEDDLYLISLVGEFDMSSTEALDAELLRAEESSAGRIVLDLSGVEFIDSSCLELLVIAKRRSDADADRLRIRPGRGEVTRLLALTKIDEFLRHRRVLASSKAPRRPGADGYRDRQNRDPKAR
jgi:anti-anti-sigma factor